MCGYLEWFLVALNSHWRDPNETGLLIVLPEIPDGSGGRVDESNRLYCPMFMQDRGGSRVA